MCGILGINRRVERTRIREIAACMSHRGPDGSGEYVSDDMTLAHRRLSIIDLPLGAQPISSGDDR